jgi:hypothetical protein
MPLYQLVDMLESPILGVFYQNELQAVNKAEDTLLYYVTTDIIYKDMQTDKHLFDFSNYDKSHFLYDSTNAKKPGLFKDWWHSYLIITQFVGLRSKMYSLKYSNVEQKKAKGIVKSVAKKI